MSECVIDYEIQPDELTGRCRRHEIIWRTTVTLQYAKCPVARLDEAVAEAARLRQDLKESVARRVDQRETFENSLGCVTADIHAARALLAEALPFVAEAMSHRLPSDNTGLTTRIRALIGGE